MQPRACIKTHSCGAGTPVLNNQSIYLPIYSSHPSPLLPSPPSAPLPSSPSAPLPSSPWPQVRRLLLHAILLCSAALAGQLEEVEHCLNQPYLSPNALGLRHKTALHLAAIAGHVSIVQLLINRGVRRGQLWVW